MSSMARKTSFYALARVVVDRDGKSEMKYFKKTGFDVPNDFGLNLAIYKRAGNESGTVETMWFVVDKDCGLSVGEGKTKKAAVQDAFEKLQKLVKAGKMDVYRQKQAESIQKFGKIPDGVMYLHNPESTT